MVQHIVFLNGVCSNSDLLSLLERLAGLCGDLQFDGTENYIDHEIVLTPAVETPFGFARRDDVVIRLIADLLRVSTDKQEEWRLCHLGVPEPVRSNTLANSRAIYEFAVIGNQFAFVEALGY
ncbi:hypothetical protein HK096_003719, partial [Nowakowskiella sp. JEL0078]